MTQRQQRRRAERNARRARRRPSKGSRWFTISMIALLVVGGVAIFWSLQNRSQREPVEPPEGTEVIEVTSREHREGPIGYDRIPPVGGPHAPVWQNCGYYSEPINPGNAVHSMEHGAVWVAYDPGLSEEQVGALRGLARTSFLLVSPLDGMDAPIVASAWGRQLEVRSASDPALQQFVDAFRLGPQTPELGATCSSGVGQPG